MASSSELDPEAVGQADAIAAMAARLNVARTPQSIADAIGDVARTFAGWFGVAVGSSTRSEPVLNLYWSAPLSDSIRARDLRVPLAVETPQTRSVNRNEAVFVPDAERDSQAEFPGPFRDSQTEGLGATAALRLVALGAGS